MKRKFYRSCVAVLLSMVMIFGGVNFGAGAVVVRPPIISTPEIEITNTQNILTFGETMQMTYSANMSGGDVYWSISENSNIAAISSSGLVTAKNAEGTVVVTATYEIGGMTAVDTIQLYVRNGVIGIENNAQYYVMNASAKKLLSLTEQTDVAHSHVDIIDRSNSDISKWIVEFQLDNTVQFINVYSPTAKCLTVEYSYLYIDTDTNTNTNTNAAQKFTLERVTEGDYRGLYRIKYGNYFVSLNVSGRVFLTTTETERSYWSFMAVQKGYADIFGFNQRDGNTTRSGGSGLIDSTAQFDNFKTTMSNSGYISEKYVDQPTSDAYTSLQTRDIFVYVGHGYNGMLVFRPDPTEEDPEGRIVAHSNIVFTDPNTFYINEMRTNALAKARCVLYLGCNTGSDYSLGGTDYNLVDATFEQGAHFALGFTETVVDADVDDFIEGFLLELSRLNDCTIEDCINMANDNVAIDTTNDQLGMPTYVRGDKYQYLELF